MRRLMVVAAIGLAVVGGWAVPCSAAPRPVTITVPNPIAPITGLGGAVSGLADDAARESARQRFSTRCRAG